VRIFKTGHAVFVLLLVTFGLFLANTLGLRSPAPDRGSDLTVTIFTDLPSQPDTPALGLGLGGVMFVVAILCGVFAFVSATLATFAVWRCRSLSDLPALTN